MTTPEPKNYVIMTRDDCPTCGSKNLAVKKRVDALVATGKMDKNTVPCLMPMSTIVTEPNPVLIGIKTAEQITAVTEVCEDCGTIFASQLICSEAVSGMVPPGMQMPKGLN